MCVCESSLCIDGVCERWPGNTACTEHRSGRLHTPWEHTQVLDQNRATAEPTKGSVLVPLGSACVQVSGLPAGVGGLSHLEDASTQRGGAALLLEERQGGGRLLPQQEPLQGGQEEQLAGQLLPLLLPAAAAGALAQDPGDVEGQVLVELLLQVGGRQPPLRGGRKVTGETGRPTLTTTSQSQLSIWTRL